MATLPTTILHNNRVFIVAEAVVLPNGFGWQLFTHDAVNDLPRLFVVKFDGTVIA